ncbi:MAG TPA: ornithine cyclodeaminase family protein [Thermoleophilaceae bacterium]|nr:ornithine cyclodeaminase family protein [Thermoleophilaceae bacterium]
MPPTLRYLTRADVEAVGLTGAEVIEILGEVFRAKRDGAVEMPAKIGIHPRDDAFIHAMPAYLESADAAGIKWVAGYPDNQDAGLPYIHGLFVLTDAGTGAPLAVMDATWITEIRTAAASMLGIRALAERPVETLGILGCGRQGTVHLELAKEALPALARVTLFDRHPERAEALAAAHPDLDVRVADRADQVAENADAVITTAAIVRDPDRPLHQSHLADATVACAIDFDASLSEDLFENAALFVVDDVPQYRHYVELGYFEGYPADPVELCDVLDPPPGLRVFVPLGIALEDVAVAAEINRRASEAGLGTELPL